MGKDLKIKHSVSSPPPTYRGTFLIKELCMGKQTFLGKFLGGCFTWGLMIRSCKVSFSSHWSWPGLLIYYFEKLTPKIGDWIWKTPFAHFASGVGDFI